MKDYVGIVKQASAYAKFGLGPDNNNGDGRSGKDSGYHGFGLTISENALPTAPNKIGTVGYDNDKKNATRGSVRHPTTQTVHAKKMLSDPAYYRANKDKNKTGVNSTPTGLYKIDENLSPSGQKSIRDINDKITKDWVNRTPEQVKQENERVENNKTHLKVSRQQEAIEGRIRDIIGKIKGKRKVVSDDDLKKLAAEAVNLENQSIVLSTQYGLPLTGGLRGVKRQTELYNTFLEQRERANNGVINSLNSRFLKNKS